MPHSAVLLAGGKSSRMGRDKAGLVVFGMPLWQRQVETLRHTSPTEIFISGRPDGPYWENGLEILEDDWPEAGPLGGVATALRRCTTPLLLVLAVDVLDMSGGYLCELVARAEGAGRGFIPRRREGHWEPMAAVYPREALAIAEKQLTQGQSKMAVFIEKLAAQEMVVPVEIAVSEEPLFENWNYPQDVRA